jgi:ABC-type branched-subunit amino acid transport system ATPase component
VPFEPAFRVSLGLFRQFQVDTLADLYPPLESVLTSQYERNDESRVQRTTEAIKASRVSDPEAALLNLGFLLKRVRDKREHRFKARHRQRDLEILQRISVWLTRIA